MDASCESLLCNYLTSSSVHFASLYVFLFAVIEAYHQLIFVYHHHSRHPLTILPADETLDQYYLQMIYVVNFLSITVFSFSSTCLKKWKFNTIHIVVFLNHPNIWWIANLRSWYSGSPPCWLRNSKMWCSKWLCNLLVLDSSPEHDVFPQSQSPSPFIHFLVLGLNLLMLLALPSGTLSTSTSSILRRTVDENDNGTSCFFPSGHLRTLHQVEDDFPCQTWIFLFYGACYAPVEHVLEQIHEIAWSM